MNARGEFSNRRGEFIKHETFNHKAILTRFGISDITPLCCKFEQAFSDNGGTIRDVHWIATDTRVCLPNQCCRTRASRGAR